MDLNSCPEEECFLEGLLWFVHVMYLLVTWRHPGWVGQNPEHLTQITGAHYFLSSSASAALRPSSKGSFLPGSELTRYNSSS